MIIKLDNNIINTDEIAFISSVENEYIDIDPDIKICKRIYAFDVVFRNNSRVKIKTNINLTAAELTNYPKYCKEKGWKKYNEETELFWESYLEKAQNKVDFILKHMPKGEIAQYDPEIKYKFSN